MKQDIDIEFTPTKTTEEQDSFIEFMFATNQIPNSLLKKLEDSIDRCTDEYDNGMKVTYRVYLKECYRLKKELHQKKIDGKPISFSEQESVDWALGNVIRHSMDMIYWYEKWIDDQKKEIEALKVPSRCTCCNF